MRYMIVEKFRSGKVRTLYERFDREGRLLPEGVQYIDSWIDDQVETCFQLMDSPSLKLIQEWIKHWEDVATFDIFPVISSAEARQKALASPKTTS